MALSSPLTPPPWLPPRVPLLPPVVLPFLLLLSLLLLPLLPLLPWLPLLLLPVLSPPLLSLLPLLRLLLSPLLLLPLPSLQDTDFLPPLPATPGKLSRTQAARLKIYPAISLPLSTLPEVLIGGKHPERGKENKHVFQTVSFMFGILLRLCSAVHEIEIVLFHT